MRKTPDDDVVVVVSPRSVCLFTQRAARPRSTPIFTTCAATVVFVCALVMRIGSHTGAWVSASALESPMGDGNHGTPDPLASDEFVRRWFVSDEDEEAFINTSQVRVTLPIPLDERTSTFALLRVLKFMFMCMFTDTTDTMHIARDCMRWPPFPSRDCNATDMHALRVTLYTRPHGWYSHDAPR
jgi:hypothetical protein